MKKQYPLYTAIILYGLFSCHEPAPPPAVANPVDSANNHIINTAAQQIRTGDIVLRSGKDFTSYRIRELSETDPTYSHAGIALVEDSGVYIYHIVPPDLDEDKADSVVRKETLAVFARPSKNFGIGIVRYPLSGYEIARAMHYTDSIYRQRVPFDHVFDLEEASRMYCSEMIDNILQYASAGKIQLERNSFTLKSAKPVARYLHADVKEVMKRQYIPIDHIHDSSRCTLIGQYVFLK